MWHVKEIVMFNLTEDEPIGSEEDFALWAWGPRYIEIDFTKEGVSEWNKFHKDILELKENGNPKVDIPKMMDLWRKSKN